MPDWCEINYIGSFKCADLKKRRPNSMNTCSVSKIELYLIPEVKPKLWETFGDILELNLIRNYLY